MKKFTWGYGIVAALGLFMSFILYLIFVFPIGKQNSELVTDRYYEEELRYQDVIDAKNNAYSLSSSSKPKYFQDMEGIRVVFPDDSRPEKIKIHLYRTNDASLDIKKEMILDQRKSFRLPKDVLVKGSYTLKLFWEEFGNNYQIDYDIIWK